MTANTAASLRRSRSDVVKFHVFLSAKLYVGLANTVGRCSADGRTCDLILLLRAESLR